MDDHRPHRWMLTSTNVDKTYLLEWVSRGSPLHSTVLRRCQASPRNVHRVSEPEDSFGLHSEGPLRWCLERFVCLCVSARYVPNHKNNVRPSLRSLIATMAWGAAEIYQDGRSSTPQCFALSNRVKRVDYSIDWDQIAVRATSNAQHSTLDTAEKTTRLTPMTVLQPDGPVAMRDTPTIGELKSGNREHYSCVQARYYKIKYNYCREHSESSTTVLYNI